METLVIALFVAGWLSAIFAAGCIMEAAVAKLTEIKRRLADNRNRQIKGNMQIT